MARVSATLSALVVGAVTGLSNDTCETPQLRYAQPPMVALGIPPCSFPSRPLRLAVTSCNYVDNCNVTAVAAAGIESILIDLNWATFDARPNISSPPSWSSAAWAPVAAHIQAATQIGLRVLIGPGAHVPPQYIWDAGARFVNAGGASYEPDADAWPNFVFYEELRPFVEEYYAWLGAQLANVTAAGLVSGLRLGGGHYGELSYPRGGPPGGVFWAFDPRAAAKNPVPWWRPGSLSPNGEALTFLTWYLGSMADYQDWQVVVAGAAFPGVPLAVLYPGAEASLSDLAAAVAADLPQTAWDPITAGQVRGVLVPALARTSVSGVVWCTSVSGEGSQANLGVMASLSSAVGLGRGGENVGGVDAPADMLTTIGMARRSELTLLMWLPPHTPDDPGNLTAQLPLLAALRVAAAVPATLCGSAQPAPAVLFAPSLGAFLSLGEAALEFISTNVSAPPGLRGEVMWSAGPFSGGAVVALDVNASSGALQLRRADGSVAWQCMGPSSEAVAVDGAGGSFGSASLFLTVTDGPGLRLYAGTTESPGHFVDVTTC